jgi:hypothetical protein
MPGPRVVKTTKGATLTQRLLSAAFPRRHAMAGVPGSEEGREKSKGKTPRLMMAAAAAAATYLPTVVGWLGGGGGGGG